MARPESGKGDATLLFIDEAGLTTRRDTHRGEKKSKFTSELARYGFWQLTTSSYDMGDWMLRTGFLIFGIVVLAISRVGATSPKPDESSPLFGDDGLSFWTLARSAEGPQDANAIFHFEGQSLSLDVPCYRRSWAYRYEAGVMTFANPWGSEARCNREVPPIVESFDSTIPKAKVPQISGDMMSLLDAGGRPLFVLKRLTATGLENRKWQISSFFDGTSLVSTRGKFTYPLVSHITFMHGSVLGSPGCGGFFGAYSVLGEHAKITASAFLGGLCPPGEFELSGTICDALSGDRILEHDGERLVLRDLQGRIQIVLTPWERRER